MRPKHLSMIPTLKKLLLILQKLQPKILKTEELSSVTQCMSILQTTQACLHIQSCTQLYCNGSTTVTMANIVRQVPSSCLNIKGKE